MGMDSAKLSARTRQPGHDRTFRTSETNFVEALRAILPDEWWTVEDHPRNLTKIIGGRYGIVPEAAITYRPTGRTMYFEVKNQKDGGNAEERACKHHTVQFYKLLHDVTGYNYHPFVTIMCGSLATLDRYTVKHAAYFEPDHYFCWVDHALEPLRVFIVDIAAKFLADDPGTQEVPS